MMKRVVVELEFFLRASVPMVFEYVSTSEGLSRWFCDAVIVKDDVFEFHWEGAFETARIINVEHDKKIVFHWEESEEEKDYIELEVHKSPITNETILRIKECCYEDEVSDVSELWESQVEELKKLLGA
jgi:uncharacterized protein YndB with AHSA1/START domain